MSLCISTKRQKKGLSLIECVYDYILTVLRNSSDINCADIRRHSKSEINLGGPYLNDSIAVVEDQAAKEGSSYNINCIRVSNKKVLGSEF